jgi:3'-5' exoribonuclease 1
LNYIVLDLEATCWMGRPPKGINEIIEIGAIKVNEYGEVLGQFSSLVKPVVNPRISGFCTKLTGIRQNQLNTADTFDKVVEKFRDWISEEGDDYVLGSWGSNDKGFLWSDCRLHKIDTDWLEPFIDLRQQYLGITKSMKKSNLKYIVEREGFEFEGNEHSAYTDAYNTAKVFIKYIDEWVS